ncbi:MAG: segregation/condensation protein A [Candidatus Omnitrophica bacterium]|nr:segregation/condensation protein A [Candidatus Omnitrophota bacterium]
MSYKIKLEVFEGPLDLLLHLIKKEEIDIYDIPIAMITQQYLEYLEFMKLLDLNIAGEFLVMAATLMHIKSKMLLPQPQMEEEAEEEDPRAELVKRLLEYKKFKEAATELYHRGARQSDYFARGVTLPDTDSSGQKEEYFEANFFDLITAFNKVMKEVPKKLFHEVVKDEYTIEEKIHDIFHLLVKKPSLSFYSLLKKAKNKTEIITIFLAILELIRLKEIVVKQSKVFGDIRVERNRELMTPRGKV